MGQSHRKKIDLNQGACGHSGQAYVEYILILVVTVTLVISLASMIFTPFQSFLQQFMGEYTSCLLESGELPALGASETKAPRTCVMPKFKGGKPSDVSMAIYPPSVERNSSGADINNSSEGLNRDAQDAKSSQSSLAIAARGGARIDTRSSSSDGRSSSGKTRELKIADPGGSGGGFFKGNQFANTPIGNNQKKTRAIGLDGLTDDERKKLGKTERGGKTTIGSNEEFEVKPKKTTVKPPDRKTASIEEEEQGFQFGKLMRILFIVAIIIIIISLIGGQIAQMMESWEK